MPFHAHARRARGAVAARSGARVRAMLLLGCGMALAPLTPAGAQYLIYERPYGYERPPVYVPAPRGPLHYVMLPPAEVRRRLESMGYWQVSRPVLSGRIYTVTAVDQEGPASLRLDAYSGEVLAARPLRALPPVAARPAPVPGQIPAPPPVAIGSAPRPAPAAPLPRARPPEAGLAFSAPAPMVTPPPPETAQGRVPATPAAVPGQAAAPAGPSSSAVAGSPVPAAASGPAVGPAPPLADAARAGTGAGSATPGGSNAGSASVLSRPAGTD
ncbi:hypothetical protein V5F53_03915 [Xanthobacter sp. V4C-4]|uniref:hypothetical protein n=1 Tax=Xanthobacter cornucopiae TaxID=3119924 RepID=UPI00372AF18C